MDRQIGVEEFEEDRRRRWEELSDLLDAAGRRPERLNGDQILRLARLYRAAAADLVAARRRFPTSPVVDRLEVLVRRAQGVVYERSTRRGNLIDFFADRYWALLWARRRVVGLAALVMVLPAVSMGMWALAAPEVVSGLVPPEFLWVTEADTTDQGMGAVGLAGFSTFVLTNNIRVALTAFVAGITWGIGTALLVAYNGLLFGGLVGLAADAGNLELLGAATLAHGILELSCIVVAGAAGLSLGNAMLRPGRRTRREALSVEGRQALLIAAGTAPWLVVAGLVEGYVSRVGLALGPTAIVGTVLGGIYWGLFLWRGRRSVSYASETSPPLGLQVSGDGLPGQRGGGRVDHVRPVG
ncbi:MAG TPA: stage II sporulation protein M [Acidimicrobiia bacterium]|nr:stage II sporulation protein M [Acidimicrobiia bacterium]